MLEITRRARSELSEMLCERPRRARDGVSSDDAPRAAFRLVAAGDALDLTFDAPRRGDTVYAFSGRPVLVVGPGLGEIVGDLVLDVLELPEGRRLGFRES